MRVLVVLAQVPLPEGGAPGKTAVGLLRGLLAHGVDVQAIAPRRHFTPPGEVPGDLPVEVLPVAPFGGWRARLGRYVRPRGELAGGVFAARVRELARAADVVHFEETEAAQSTAVDRPACVHLHYLVRRDRPLGRPWERQFRDGVELRLAERAAVRRHRYLVASSPLIADALRREAPAAEIVHAPLSLDPARYAPAALDRPTAGIVGTAGWPPTAAAMRSLARSVWPEVRKRLPEARLVIAGRGTEQLGLAGDGIDVLGEVDSAAALFQGLSLLLYPLPRGSGMKVKVLEALASGVPVVTTPAGAEGVEAGEGVIVRTQDDELAAAAAEILRDPEARRRRGAAARKAFELRYAPGPATRPLLALFERMR
jgi:glycosyltransferase involved in cell wall biosynthesis